MCVQWPRVLTWNGSSYGSPKCTFTSTFQWKQTRVNVALQKWWNTALCWGCRVFMINDFYTFTLFFFCNKLFLFFPAENKTGLKQFTGTTVRWTCRTLTKAGSSTARRMSRDTCCWPEKRKCTRRGATTWLQTLREQVWAQTVKGEYQKL